MNAFVFTPFKGKLALEVALTALHGVRASPLTLLAHRPYRRFSLLSTHNQMTDATIINRKCLLCKAAEWQHKSKRRQISLFK